MMNVPEYAEWLQERSQEQWCEAYRHYRSSLQWLQGETQRGHWLLKSPAHLQGLNPLMKVIPDAFVVQTHRSAQTVIASCCSLFHLMRSISSDYPDPATVGNSVLRSLSEGMRRSFSAREEFPDRLLDVHYEGVVNDPIACVRLIYERFGYEYHDEFERRMKGWLNEHPQHKHGPHPYRLDEFALTQEAVLEAFGDYADLELEVRRECESITK